MTWMLEDEVDRRLIMRSGRQALTGDFEEGMENQAEGRLRRGKAGK
jgi:hypothetical protein